MARQIAASLVVPLFCVTGVLADTYSPLSIPELIERADLVVVGEAQERDGHFVITADEVLKGRAQKEFPARARFGMGRAAFKGGSKGVFFLRRSRQGVYSPFHPGCFQKLEKRGHVRELFGVAKDPGPYTDLTRHPENADYVYVMGSSFAGYQISSNEVPQLPEKMRNFAVRYYEAVPWGQKGRADLRCSYDPNRTPSLVIESASPEGRLAEFFSSRLQTAAKWNYVAPLLKPRFAVSLDTRWPRRVGSLSSEKAVGFLRARLGSKDPQVIRAALLALAKMRDLESVPRAVQLVAHEDAFVATDAVKFLEWSRDKRAVAPLCRILDEAQAADIGSRHRIMTSACTHALMYIRDQEAVPSLERVVDRGLESCWAFLALGRVGRKESFGVLLRLGEADPSRNMMCLDGLYWLVRRSNLPIEPWMASPSKSGKIAREKLPKWRNWWDTHRDRFTITSSYEEALRQK